MSERASWIGAGVLAALATSFLLAHAIPRMEEGSEDLRHVYHALHDEGVILEGTWKMVDRGDLSHGIKVYPGFYPYQAGLIRYFTKAHGDPASIVATRWWSLIVMVLALLVTFVGFGIVAESPWVGALLVSAMALNPEMIDWTSRVHPDAWLLLLDHAALTFLALAVDRRSARLLLFATMAASLSAATKLVGCFIMVPIGLWILLQGERSWLAKIKQGFLHLGIFVGVFVATNPLIFTHGIHLLRGLSDQHRRNRKGPGQPLEWFELMVGPNALGWAGAALAILGILLFLRRPSRRLGVVLGFAVFYFVFILFGVKIIEARYAYPAVWPVLLVGLSVLRFDSQLTRRGLVAIGIGLFTLFVWKDWPRQVEVRTQLAHKYAQGMSAEKLALGARLSALAPARVCSSADVYVPQPLGWRIIWGLDELSLDGTECTIVLDPLLRDAGGPALQRLLGGQTGYVATATVGDSYVVYGVR